MGNDGGVVAVKRKFMRHANQKTKLEKVDQDFLRMERAHTCALSGDPLQEPIVACELGNLYNKQAVLEQLLAKTMPERFQHITSLKDVVTCKFSKQAKTQASETSASGNGSSSSSSSGFYCPITMVQFNGKQPFVVTWTCGCVLSERSIKEVQTQECLACGASIAGAKFVALLQAEDKYMDNQRAILERKAAEKLLKKNKSDKKRSARASGDEEESATAKKTKKKQKIEKSEKSEKSGQASIAQEATTAIDLAKANNKVFASLFAKDKSDTTRSANDLLMAVGGMRYNLS